MKIEIAKWDKYNPKNTYKSMPWFKCYNSLFDDPKLFGLTNSQKWLWVCLLCLNARNNGSLDGCTPEFLAHAFHSTTDELNQVLQHFKNKGLITIKDPDKILSRQVGDPDKTHREEKRRLEKRRGDKKEDSVAVAAEASPPPNEPKQPSQGPKVWDAYRHAYAARYGHDPARNAKVNRNCVDLISRLGVDDAVAVVKFYLTHNKSFYLEKVHMLQFCLLDCEALLTQMKSNTRFSGTDARRQEINQSNAQVFAKVAAEMAMKKQET